jgi:hypothetical protein
VRLNKFIGLAALFFALFCATAMAAGTYAGTAPVNSQSDEDRATALRAAFSQVVGKLAGNPAVLTRPDVVRALGRADRYMQSYGYETGGDPPHLQLVVQFDRSGVDALLHDLNLDTPDTASTPAAAPDTVGTAASAPPAAAPTGFRLWITGLRSAEDYARLVGSLSGNDQVRALHVEQAHGNTLQVRIDARGPLQALLDALATTRLAHVSNAQPPVAGVDALLDFEP